jgi:hypothetical protein
MFFGVNNTCIAIDWPEFNVAGRGFPTMEKPAPVIVAGFRVTGKVPEHVRVILCVEELLTATSPKFSWLVSSDSCAVPCRLLRPLP